MLVRDVQPDSLYSTKIVELADLFKETKLSLAEQEIVVTFEPVEGYSGRGGGRSQLPNEYDPSGSLPRRADYRFSFNRVVVTAAFPRTHPRSILRKLRK